ncbi:MAG: hypothetical protein GY851_01285 [bacterium]|nr:hypothetical protein [bacterium]
MMMLRFPGDLFPFGARVYREPHPDMDEVLNDLPLLAQLGFNMVHVQESWAIDEPREGEVNVSRIERIVERADELGLGVCFGFTMEQAPAWFWRKSPDCRLVYADGRPHNDPAQYAHPSGGKPGPCWDHSGARAVAERFIAEVVRRLGRYDNILAWNVWHDVGFGSNDGGALGFCYCHHTLVQFREWLRTRYDSLSDLNNAWQTAFGHWDEVDPPRGDACCPIFVDWRYFMDDVYLTHVLEWKAQAVRTHDPQGRPVLCNVANAQVGRGAEWRWARALDLYGADFYPSEDEVHLWDDGAQDPPARTASRERELWESLCLETDLARSAAGDERPVWAAEFQGGPIAAGLQLGHTPDPGDIRRWVLGGLAAGLNGLSFSSLRAATFWRECNGFGLLGPQGESTPRIEEAGRIARALNEDPALFSLGAPPKAQVAILVSEDLYHFCQPTEGDALKHLAYSVRGLYYEFWRAGVQVDFVEAEDVADGALRGYDLAVLPMPIALGIELVTDLAVFVEQGGTLLSEACPGRFTEYGFCPRGQLADGADALFGARHAGLHVVREPVDVPPRWTAKERRTEDAIPPAVLEGTGPLNGCEVRANVYLQTLQPVEAAPVLTHHGRVVGVINSVGQGRAMLAGTFLGHGARAHRLQGQEAFFARILDLAGVRREQFGRLLRRRRVLGTSEAWFFLNPEGIFAEETVALEGYAFVRDLLGDAVVAHDEKTVSVHVPPCGVACVVVRAGG